MTRTPWAGGRVCGVSRTGGKPEGSGPWPKPWLLAPDGPCTHDFIQQTTTWSPHGRGPCLTVTKLQFSINYQHVILEQKNNTYNWVLQRAELVTTETSTCETVWKIGLLYLDEMAKRHNKAQEGEAARTVNTLQPHKHTVGLPALHS